MDDFFIGKMGNKDEGSRTCMYIGRLSSVMFRFSTRLWGFIGTGCVFLSFCFF